MTQWQTTKRRSRRAVVALMARSPVAESWMRPPRLRPNVGMKARRSVRCAQMRLPSSSIYWHFKDKDALLAAVIERSFTTWLSAWELPDEGSPIERAESLAVQTAKAVLDSPDFLRLGLMLALERRPVEPQARARFLEVRDEAQRLFGEDCSQWFRG